MASESHVTACVNYSKNPHGHNRECKCGWWEREQAERAPVNEPYEKAELHAFFGVDE